MRDKVSKGVEMSISWRSSLQHCSRSYLLTCFPLIRTCFHHGRLCSTSSLPKIRVGSIMSISHIDNHSDDRSDTSSVCALEFMQCLANFMAVDRARCSQRVAFLLGRDCTSNTLVPHEIAV